MNEIDFILTSTLLVFLFLAASIRYFFYSEEKHGPDLLACPRCGSKEISSLKHMKNWLKKYGPLMGVYYCRNCGYEGPPLQVDDEKQLKKLFKKYKEEDMGGK